jgi:hypothetical protein
MSVVLGFTVEIHGAGSGSDVDSAWESCTGGGLNIEVCDSSTGSDQFHTTTPGHKYVDTLTLRGPLTAGRKALCDWINATVRGQDWKRTVTITELVSEQGVVREGRRFTYFDCFPVRYRFPTVEHGGTTSIVEEIEFAVERIERPR